jgi:hypothetical protein
MNRALLIGALLMLMSPGFTTAQDAADFDRDGITYYWATGTVDSGHMSVGLNYTGENQEPFFGCTNVFIRDEPGRDNGRVQMLSQHNGTHMFIDMSRFEGAVEGQDAGANQDIYVDGSRTHVGEIQHPAVFAGMAAWGTAYLQIDLNNTYRDPVTDNEEFRSTLFITPEGFRDNSTGAVYNRDGSIYQPGSAAVLGENDWELHLRLESLGGPRAPPLTWTETRPAGENPYFTPTEAYREVFIMRNDKFGGTLTYDVSASALAQDGDNSLTFVVRDPVGNELDRFTGAPSVLENFAYRGEVPLSRFGYYTVEVLGAVSLSQYSIDFAQTSPATFDLDFWWDNVTFGGEATQALWDCEDIVGSPSGNIVESIVTQAIPPRFDWLPIGLGGLGTVLGIVIMGKMLAMTVKFNK